MGARTPLLRVLQGISRDYAAAEQAGCTVQEVQAERRDAQRKEGLTRREILKAGALGATSAAVGSAVLLRQSLPAAAPTTPRIAIIGAGTTGLNAPFPLQAGPTRVPPY